MGWIQDAKAHDWRVLADLAGVQPYRDSTAGPCPNCGRDRRGSKDRRGPVNLRKTGEWHCQRCKAGGDALNMVAYLETRKGLEECDAGDLSRVRERLAAAGLCEPQRGSAPSPRRAKRHPQPPAPQQYWEGVQLASGEAEPPPVDEAHALWAMALPLFDDEAARQYIASPTERGGRGLGERAIDFAVMHDLCRVLPPDAKTLPRWARIGRRSWAKSGHRLLFPLHDATGEIRSFKARWIPAKLGAEPPTLKSVVPKGDGETRYGITGLVIGDVGAAALLQDNNPEWWPGTGGRVVICEGEIDALAWTTRYSDADTSAPAVFGVFPGAWRQQHADRIPNGAVVTMALDLKADGKTWDQGAEAIGSRILETLAPRQRAGEISVRRWVAKIPEGAAA